MIISKRLQFIANIVGHCEVLGDVGSDHALLPIYMVSSGMARRAVASDINKGPVARGKMNVSVNHLSDKIEVRLCPGLTGYAPKECDCVVIAGMGGNLIAEILEQSAEVAHSVDKFVLSPNSCENDLRVFLWHNGYEIFDESAVCEENHQYLVMEVRYKGQNTENTKETYSENEVREYLGDILPNKREDPEVLAYLNGIKKKLEIRAKGLKSAEKFDQIEYEKIESVLKALE